MKVLIIGISDKIDVKPFDSTTNTGKIIDTIENRCGFPFYKINLVSYAPLDNKGKVRYPTSKEIKDNLPNLLNYISELKPDKLILFGKLVQSTLSNIKFDFECQVINTYHPSYMWIYKRKQLDSYINNIVQNIISR